MKNISEAIANKTDALAVLMAKPSCSLMVEILAVGIEIKITISSKI